MSETPADPQSQTALSLSKSRLSDEQKYLPTFRQIAPRISYYDPPSHLALDTSNSSIVNGKPDQDEIEASQRTNANNQDGPDLIILCAWMHAQPRHIAKYTAQHQLLFPSSSILLLRQDGGDFTWRPESWQMQNMVHAVELISKLDARDESSSTRSTSTPARPLRVLMHVFSNGGAYTAYALEKCWNNYYSKSSSNSTLLPLNALVLDSLPGRTTLSIAVTAFSQILPATLPSPLRFLGISALYAMIFAMRLPSRLPWPIYRPDRLRSCRERLNAIDSAFMSPSIVERVYIYSEADELIPWRDVEGHAAETKRALAEENRGTTETLREKGEKVRLEKFEGSKHVAHAMADSKRYWGIITGLWSEVTDRENGNGN